MKFKGTNVTTARKEVGYISLALAIIKSMKHTARLLKKKQYVLVNQITRKINIKK